MTNAKPMTPERRAEIDTRMKLLEFLQGCCDTSDLGMMRDLLADAAFWRDAVRKANPFGSFATCIFCQVMRDIESREATQHMPYCGWLLSQSGV